MIPLNEEKKTTSFDGSWMKSKPEPTIDEEIDSWSLLRASQDSLGATVLPNKAAGVVSFCARGSTLLVRLATYVTETALDNSRASVLSTLGVSRRILENILSKADEDTPGATRWTTSCMTFVNESATLAHFATNAYFHLATSLVSTVSYLWQDSIHILNSIFGSTDSSRAIATILDMVRRELGDGVGVYTLASTLVFFSIVQSRSWKRTLAGIETVPLWDVVVLDSGETLAEQQTPDRRGKREFEDGNVIHFLPGGASYQISADQEALDTITVEITADATGHLWPPGLLIPPGSVIVQEESSTKRVGDKTVSHYRLVFEKRSRRFRERKGRVPDTAPEQLETQSTDGKHKKLDQGPEVVENTRMLASNEELDKMTDSQVFPAGHLTYNMAKFVRYASASYGHSFMKLLGIGISSISFPKGGPGDGVNHHSEHYAFAHHARLKLDQILLSSYTDMAIDDTSGIPLVHFVAVDHEAKAVVLTIRGTLGLEDILTDLTCDYSSFQWLNRTWKAHGGMLRCAELLARPNSRVLQTIANALQQWGPEYGLILCGHSLGGGVAAILGILLSEKTSDDCFITGPNHTIPAGRPMKVFTFGPPASICSSLRLETRQLITSVVYGLDVVPCLSLGLLRDFHSLAQTLKNDERGIVEEIRRRFLSQIPIRGPLSQQPEQDDDYLFSIMTTLRYVMQNEKLVPPGEVYHINTSTVFETHDGYTRKATKVVGSLIVDVDQRFREPVFGREIFHHNPVYYEKALNTLEMGVSQAPL